jgi:hypothetical protein
MFLIKAICVLSVSVGTFAVAAPLPGLEAGHYGLVEGSPKLCAPYRLSELDLQSPRITVGGRYALILKNARKQIESDLDANCEFIEEATKAVSGAESTVTRTNSEVCGQSVKSKITSKFTFRGEQVILDHQIQEETRQVGYRCVWARTR